MSSRSKQQEFNVQTRSRWETFASHRQQVTDSICEMSLPVESPQLRPNLAILGAGNGNDFDIRLLLEKFSRIHLFDFDNQALSHFQQQQLKSLPGSERVVIEPLVDLTGIADDLEQLPLPLTEQAVEALAEKARTVPRVLSEHKFDTVVSTCLLTQILSAVVNGVGDDSPWKNYMMIAARDGHLKLMSRLVRPGGMGLLVTDFVSSDTLPELITADNREKAIEVARQAIDNRNFFTGTNPWLVRDALAKTMNVSQADAWQIKQPWRWQIGDRRFYLATAIRFEKPIW